jgi:transposase
LLKLADWLTANGCQHVALESTGVYWKPVYNILEGVCEEVLLVNAQHIKNVPGRKTDVKDSEWIADLMMHGLLSGSFVPPPEIRELRELTRYRKKLIEQRADQCNRIQKLLEACNIKLASVATDVLGVSGLDMLLSMVEGETDPAKLADLARGRMRQKIPQLAEALQGHMSDTQRWLLGEELEQISQMDQAIGRLDQKIEELTRPFGEVIERLSEIPGVGRRIAEVIIAEIGLDMSQFPSSKNLASWAGMCPGHHESAGKRKSGRTRDGNVWLKKALMEAGWAASHSKHNYLRAQYDHLARHRGKKRACVGVGHSILTIAYHLISDETAHYKDLGEDYFQTRSKTKLAESLIKRLSKLGYNVTIESAA